MSKYHKIYREDVGILFLCKVMTEEKNKYSIFPMGNTEKFPFTVFCMECDSINELENDINKLVDFIYEKNEIN